MPRRRVSPAHRKGSPGSAAQGVRLQKVLAEAGLGSRRRCETLIEEGRVEIDRRVVTQLGVRVDPLRQEIRVDGAALPRPQKVYYLLNKPAGVVCTNRDPQGRPRVIDLIRTEVRLFTVGRLDRASEGLILVTNDGELANQLAHPRYAVEKTYVARVAGRPGSDQLKQLRQGVHLAEGFARVSGLRIKRRYPHSTDLEIVLREGRNREIRRLLARVGHKVLRLKRIGLGPLRLGDLPCGAYRTLSAAELGRLKRAAKRTRGKSSPVAKPSGGPSKGDRSPSTPRAKPDHPPRQTQATGTVLDYEAPREATPRQRQRAAKKGAHATRARKRGRR